MFMKDRCQPNIATEWGNIKTVLVHTPGTELKYVDVLDPNYLMEERPDIDRAAQEHQDFIATLRRTSQSTVLEIRDLLLDVFEMYEQEPEREQLLAEILFDDYEFSYYQKFRDAGIEFPHLCAQAIEDAKRLKSQEIVQFIYEGWNSANWPRYHSTFRKRHLAFLLEMNNSYFTRDPGFTLDDLFVTSNMTRKVRKREARVLDLVLRNHPWFEGATLKSFVRGSGSHRIEGGDVVAIGPKQLAVGWSERTSFEAIETLALELTNNHDYEKIFAIPIPKRRAFMHLDTVFSYRQRTAPFFWLEGKQSIFTASGELSYGLRQTNIPKLQAFCLGELDAGPVTGDLGPVQHSVNVDVVAVREDCAILPVRGDALIVRPAEDRIDDDTLCDGRGAGLVEIDLALRERLVAGNEDDLEVLVGFAPLQGLGGGLDDRAAVLVAAAGGQREQLLGDLVEVRGQREDHTNIAAFLAE